MEVSGAGSRKRKSAALEGIDEAQAAPAPLVAPDHLRGAGEEDGRVGEEGGGLDRLSSLPDGVLGEIICLLPTKEGARTRILAPRWRDLWLSAPLNLDCRELTASVLTDIVSRILSSHHGPARRLIFISSNPYIIPAHTVEAWLRSAALDNLEELDFNDHGPEQPRRSLIFRFSCTLRVVNITGCNLSDTSFQGLHLPLLKQLGLLHVTISGCSLHTLIVGCPSLECLLICEISRVSCLRITSLTVRRVSLSSRQKYNTKPLERVVIENAPCLLSLVLLEPEDNLHVSIISAPKLETLGFVSDDTCHEGEFSTLVFGSTVIKGLFVDKLITVVQSVKILALDMPFLNLDTVIQLMRCFPCLEKLYIQSYVPSPSYDWFWKQLNHSNGSRPGNFWGQKHLNLIRCLDLRMKKIVLTNYWGLKSDVNFVTFFVLNAKLLESVTLGINGSNNNEEFLAEQREMLQIENRVSRDARIHFTTDESVRTFYGHMHVRDLDVTDPFTTT